jgi:hypothetical protein
MHPLTCLTSDERRFGGFMLICGCVYLLGGLSFWVFAALNQAIAEWFVGFASLPISEPFPAAMWVALGVSLMWMLGASCLLAGWDPRRNRLLAVPVMVSKLVSTLAAFSFVLSGVGQASALAVVLTDLPLFFATVWLYHRAVRSVGGRWLGNGPITS